MPAMVGTLLPWEDSAMPRRVAVIGVPSGAGACGVGQEQTPAAIRAAGLIEQLGRVGFEVSDLGDSPVVPWRPDRANLRAQNLEAVVEVVQSTARRRRPGRGDRIALVLGGDCTVGIGTVAGVQQVVGRVALAWFDLHSDLNTPASATEPPDRSRPTLGAPGAVRRRPGRLHARGIDDGRLRGQLSTLAEANCFLGVVACTSSRPAALSGSMVEVVLGRRELAWPGATRAYHRGGSS